MPRAKPVAPVATPVQVITDFFLSAELPAAQTLLEIAERILATRRAAGVPAKEILPVVTSETWTVGGTVPAVRRARTSTRRVPPDAAALAGMAAPELPPQGTDDAPE